MARDSGTHRCPVGGCRIVVPDGMLMCRAHWSKVSPDTQATVWRAWRARQAGGVPGADMAHCRAVNLAIQEAEYYTSLGLRHPRVRGLTLIQPWASCCVVGPKRVENRSWTIDIAPVGGRWVAFHAGAELDKAMVEKLRPEWPDMPDTFPRKRVLALVHLVEVLDARSAAGRERIATDPFAFGPKIHVFDRVLPMPEPRECLGARQLWRLPLDLLRQAEALLDQDEVRRG